MTSPVRVTGTWPASCGARVAGRARWAGMALALVGALAAPAAADTIKVAPGEDAQAAIGAAAPADTVLLLRGTHTANLVIPPNKPGLVLKGQSGTLLDAHLGAVGVLVLAADVTVSHLTIRHALETGVVVPGVPVVESGSAPQAGFTLDRVIVLGAGSEVGVSVSADDIVFSRCEVSGFDAGFVVSGAGLSMLRCTVRHVESVGIEVAGDDATLERCEVDGVSGGPAVLVLGDRARLSRNFVARAADEGLYVVGEDAAIERNSVESAADGINLDGGDGSIDRNHVTGAADTGIDAQSGLAVTVSRNLVERARRHGIQSQATGGTFSSNTVRDGSDADRSGLWLSGDGNVVEHNRITGCGDAGIRVWGDGNVIRDNSSSRNGDDGLHVDTGFDPTEGTVVEGNSFSRNQGEGLHNEGEGTTFTGNRFSHNRIDVANDADEGATLTDGGKNSYDGEVVPPEID